MPILIPLWMRRSCRSLITYNDITNRTVAAAIMSRAFQARHGFWLNECGRRIAVRRSIATNTRSKMEKNTATLNNTCMACSAKMLFGVCMKITTQTHIAVSATANANMYIFNDDVTFRTYTAITSKFPGQPSKHMVSKVILT